MIIFKRLPAEIIKSIKMLNKQNKHIHMDVAISEDCLLKNQTTETPKYCFTAQGMSRVVNIEEVMPHKGSEVMCVKCCKRWIATRPSSTLLKTLECPKCGKVGFAIETGETNG